MFDAEHAAFRVGKQFLVIGIAPTSEIKARIKAKMVKDTHEYESECLPGGTKFHCRMLNTDYKYGAEKYNSHAVAVRFPLDSTPQLCDSGLKTIWPLSLAKLNCSIHRITAIYEVAEDCSRSIPDLTSFALDVLTART